MTINFGITHGLISLRFSHFLSIWNFLSSIRVERKRVCKPRLAEAKFLNSDCLCVTYLNMDMEYEYEYEYIYMCVYYYLTSFFYMCTYIYFYMNICNFYKTNKVTTILYFLYGLTWNTLCYMNVYFNFENQKSRNKIWKAKTNKHFYL